MKKLLKRIMSLALVATIFCGIFGTVPVSAASLKYDKTATAYMDATSKKYGLMHTYAEIYLKNCSAKPKSVKLSSSDLGLTAVQYSKSKKTARIVVNSSKVGTYKVSFKVNGKKYTSKVVFKKYVCPVSSIKITGVMNGQNIASYTKNANCNIEEIKLNENVSNANLTLKIKNNWKLTGLSLARYKDGHYDKTMGSKENIKATGTKTYKLGNLETSKSYSYVLAMTFVNKNNGGSVVLTYDIKS